MEENSLQPIDPIWDIRKDNDLFVNAKYSITFPYPLNQPPKDNSGNHETEYKLQSKNMICEYTGKKEFGIPYGSDSLIASWIRNKAIKQKSNKIIINSANEILKDLNRPRTAQSYKWLKSSLLRVLNTRISYRAEISSNNINTVFTNWIKAYNIWCDDSFNSEADNFIVLSEDYFKMLMEETTTIEEDLKMLTSLSSTPGAMQLYRVANLESRKLLSDEKPSMSIPIENFKERMGVSKERDTAKFKAQLKYWSEKVNSKMNELYENKNTAPFIIDGDNIRIFGSNLIPMELDIEGMFPTYITDYLNGIKRATTRSSEKNQIKALLSKSYTIEDIEKSMKNVFTEGDIRKRKIKNIVRYLNKENNIDLILERINKKASTAH